MDKYQAQKYYHNDIDKINEYYAFINRNAIRDVEQIKYLSGTQHRLAICISGHMRTYEQTYEWLKNNIIIPFEEKGWLVDIFIATWSNYGYNFRNKTPDSPLDIDKVVSMYHPAGIKVEQQNLHERSLINKTSSYTNCTHNLPWTIASIYYKIWQCNRLKSEYEEREDFEYDLVWRMRPDLRFTPPYFSLPSIDELTQNRITIWTRGDDANLRQLSDLLFCGPSKLMNVMCDLFNHTDELYEKYNVWCPHISLLNWTKMQNIPLREILLHNDIILYD